MKQHTIILVPHQRAKFRKWRFTTLQAGLLIGTLAILTLGGIVATFLYIDTSFDRGQLAKIQQENDELSETNKGFERSIDELESQLEEYQQQIQKLAIVAGIAELSPAAEAGIGGPLMSSDGVFYRPEEEGDLALLESGVDALGRDMDRLRDSFNERWLLISSTPAVTPVKGLLTSKYGFRRDPFTQKKTFHGGIDLVAPRGKEVRATGDGFVVKAGRATGLGRTVYLSHGYGITTRYGHLLKITVEEGQKIKRGDVIGLVGNSGRSTGYHLHYEVRVDGRAQDPLGYILDSTKPTKP